MQPLLFLTLWVVLKLRRMKKQAKQSYLKWWDWHLWKDWRSCIGVDLSEWQDFRSQLRRLHNLINPGETPVAEDADDPEERLETELVENLQSRVSNTLLPSATDDNDHRRNEDEADFEDDDEEETTGEFRPRGNVDLAGRRAAQGQQANTRRRRTSESGDETRNMPPGVNPALRLTRPDTFSDVALAD